MPTLAEAKEVFDRLRSQLDILWEAKAEQYATDSDVLESIREIASREKRSMAAVVRSMMAKHEVAIDKAVKEAIPDKEMVKERIKDLFVYEALLWLIVDGAADV